MKKRLLSFFALAMMVLAVSAQSWTAPSIKLVTDQVPEKAYIYNVEQKMFLTKGGAWGNHASIKSDVSIAFLYEMQAQQEGGYKLHCSAGANNGMLGRQSVEDVYTDWKAQTDWGLIWDFVAVDGGFHIRTAANDPNYGDEVNANNDTDYNTYVLGYNPERDDLTNGSGDPMGTHDGIYMVDPTNMEGYSVLWAFMTEEDYAIYNAQMILYNKLNEAVEVGYSESELGNYAALLTSTDAAAIDEAVKAVDNMILNYAYNHASPENPFEVTAKIVNPTFDGARDSEPAGWTDEFGNMKIQNNKAYHIWDEENNVESGEYGLNNFSQNWTSSNTDPIAASNIYQVISDLPQGTYILQADAIATSASASLEVSGAELYAESGAAHYAQAIDKSGYGMDGSGFPHRYQLMVTHMGGDLKIGYGFTPGYVKWFAVDNMKLFYAGPVDNPGLVALTAALESAQPYIDYYAEESKYYYSENAKDALDKAINNGQSVMGGSSETCLAAAGDINDALKAVKAEVTAYGKLASFVQTVAADVDKYPFIDDLGDKYDMYRDAYEDKTATIDQINEWIDGYAEYVVASIKSALPKATEANPIEITGLFKNLAFEENTTESSTPTNWTSNSAAFKARANVGEVWNETFDTYTTLGDLPAGAYRVTAHALTRSGSSVENYAAEGASTSAEFYANGFAAPIKSQHLGASAEMLYSNDVNLTGDEENPLWAPNSMEGARVYFNVENTPYVNEVVANLVNDGDPLKIGFRDNGVDGAVAANSWTIWSDVRVYYIGVNSNALYEEMKNLAAQVRGLMDASDAEMVAQSYTNLLNAYTAAEAAKATDAEESIVAIINQLNGAVAYYNEGKALVTKVGETIDAVEAILETYDVNGTELKALNDVMGKAYANESFESNEQMQGWIDAVPAARTAHIFAYAENEAEAPASEEAPLDVTDVIDNASFAAYNANGWTITNEGGAVGGQQPQREGSSAYEIWNATAFDIHQTVVGLKEGYYRLSVRALFRNGNNSDDLAAQYFADPAAAKLAQFYANDNAVSVKYAYEEALTEDPAINGQCTTLYEGKTYYSPNTMISFEDYAVGEALGLYENVIILHMDGKTDLTLGLRYKGGAANAWLPFDEFKVAYLGTKAPTAVESVSVARPGVAQIFSVNGQQQSSLQKGVNIIRKQDGKVVKLLVK